MPTSIVETVALTALNHMFKQGHFSICTIDAVAAVLNVHPHGHIYTMLRALHCISYSEMPKEVYDKLPELIRECLHMQTIFQFEELKQKTVVMSPLGKFIRLLR